MSKKSIKVHIIGGGVSGLVAAQVLENHGISPVIIDANDRVGIGTTLPNFTFEVIGDVGIANSLTVNDIVSIAKTVSIISTAENIPGNTGTGAFDDAMFHPYYSGMCMGGNDYVNVSGWPGNLVEPRTGHYISPQSPFNPT